MLHQSFCAFDGSRGHAANRIRRQAFLDAGFSHHTRTFINTLGGGRVRRKHNRVSRLGCNQDFEDRS
jgi:hypothetical protein